MAPSPFWKAVAPMLAAASMCARAARFFPSFTATGSHSLISRMPSSAMPSASRVEARRAVGLEAMRERVHAGGRGDARRQADRELRVRDDDRGSIFGWKMIFFWCVDSSRMTDARPTSEPVPAVVGTAIVGAMPATFTRVYQSSRSSKSHSGRVCPTMSAMVLPASSALPPPKAMTPSQPLLR